jgi:TPR repeat protein
VQAAVEAYEAGRLDDARRQFERLSRSGSAVADYNLAVMHLRGELPASSFAQAVALLERAAARGFVTAMFDLGRLHEDGMVTGRPDATTAHRWYLQAAEAGSVDAQVAVATAYYLGRGAPEDAREAAHWYREAANRGNVGAQYLIASMYESGLGVQRDLRIARYWYDAAARNGDEAAAGKVRELDSRRASPDS